MLQLLCRWIVKGKGKAFPYSIPSVGPGADPGVQELARRVRHPPGGRLPLLSAWHAVTSPATEQHRPLAGTKLYCLVTEAHRCKQLAQGCYAALPWVGFEPATYWSQLQRLTRCATALNDVMQFPTFLFVFCVLHLRCCYHIQGEWKPKQIPNPAYKGKWVHPEIENPEYQPDENLYRYTDIGAVGFDLWQVWYFFLLLWQ